MYEYVYNTYVQQISVHPTNTGHHTREYSTYREGLTVWRCREIYPRPAPFYHSSCSVPDQLFIDYVQYGVFYCLLKAGGVLSCLRQGQSWQTEMVSAGPYGHANDAMRLSRFGIRHLLCMNSVDQQFYTQSSRDDHILRIWLGKQQSRFGVKGFVMSNPRLVQFWRFCPRMDANNDWLSVNLSWRKMGRVSGKGSAQLQ